MNYYSHNIGDYAQATAHLSLLEDAIYSRLLRRYYAEEQPIVDNLQQVFRWVGARSEEEREAAAQVLAEFFVLRDGHWHNKRADVESAAYHVKAETAKANGRRGGRPRQGGRNPEQPSGFPMGFDEQPGHGPAGGGSEANQEPGTQNQEPTEHASRKRGSGFDASVIELPDWLDREDWVSWIADRKARKKPVTQEGARRQLQQLAAYLAAGHRPGAVIANSIAGGYQGLFPPRTSATAGQQPAGRAQRLADWTEELREVLADDGRPRERFMGTIDATR